MSSSEQAPEPTMDEILASIRKIIADDEQSPAQRPEAAPEAQPAPAGAEAGQSSLVDDIASALDRSAEPAPGGDDIFDLTQEIPAAEPPAPMPPQPAAAQPARPQPAPPPAAVEAPEYPEPAAPAAQGLAPDVEQADTGSADVLAGSPMEAATFADEVSGFGVAVSEELPPEIGGGPAGAEPAAAGFRAPAPAAETAPPGPLGAAPSREGATPEPFGGRMAPEAAQADPFAAEAAPERPAPEPSIPEPAIAASPRVEASLDTGTYAPRMEPEAEFPADLGEGEGGGEVPERFEPEAAVAMPVVEPRDDRAAAPVPSAAAEQPEAPAEAVKSLEDSVREMLRPMLKDWLDEHMPRIVEGAVRQEFKSGRGNGNG